MRFSEVTLLVAVDQNMGDELEELLECVNECPWLTLIDYEQREMNLTPTVSEVSTDPGVAARVAIEEWRSERDERLLKIVTDDSTTNNEGDSA